MKKDLSDVKTQCESERLGRLYPVILEQYNPAYVRAYLDEESFLLSVFGKSALRISHIGSTAVPGLISKPTVDILLEIAQNTDLALITERLTSVGYIVNRPPTDIITFIKGYGENGFQGQVYHIHVRELGDYNEFYFRDYLIAHPEIAGEYGKLKIELQKRFEHDRDGYTYAKGEFVGRITALARAALTDKYNPAE